MNRKVFFMLVVTLVMSCILPFSIRANSDKGVYIIPIKGEIGPAVSSFVSNQLEKASDSNSQIIIFDIDTLGGRVSETIKIQKVVKEYSKDFKIYTYVNNKAESAGVMLTLLGDKIYMTPDATMGSSSVIPFDEKTNSAWAAMLKAQAESKGRRGDIAQGTADYDIVIPNIKEKGKLLNLAPTEAKKFGYCDGIAKDINAMIMDIGYRGNRIFYAEKDARVRISELISNSYIAALLLLIGIAALIIEAFIPSFGIAGTVGVIFIVLYFLGNIFTGNTGWWALIIFVVGMLFLIVEALIPGFGVSGITGLIGISASIVLSSGDLKSGLILLIAAWAVVILTVFILLKYGMNLGFLSKIILKTDQRKENGYSVKESSEMTGMEGTSSSQLRPAGIGLFNGKRFDVQTEGEFVGKGAKIVILRVEGNKIFVKEKGEN